MKTFEYTVARFVSDPLRDEPVNIGVIIHESSKKISYGKFLDNFRIFKQRNPKVNCNALQAIVDGYRGENKIDSQDYLTRLWKECIYSLRFTKPQLIEANSTEEALVYLFNDFISIESKKKTRPHLSRGQLKSRIRKRIIEAEIDQWVKINPRVPGQRAFSFDYGFVNGKVNDLIHAISFDSDQEKALHDAQSLALTVENVKRINTNLACTAVIHPPHNGENKYFDDAQYYLDKKKCIIQHEEDLPKYLAEVKKKLYQESK